MATTDLDVIRLSSFCSLPQISITTLLDAPTTELVNSVLTAISSRAREFDELKAQNLKLNVELENAVRGGELKSRAIKASLEKASKKAEGLQQALEAEKQARTSLESELEILKASAVSSVSEISDAHARISSLETSNRSTLSLLESKSTACDKLTEEVANHHQKTVELRREVSNLEQSIQSANAASSNAKYREQGLQQELEHLKRTNEWLEKELKTKSEEYTKYRKEKGNWIAELQSKNDECVSTIHSLSVTESNLRKRLEELSQKVDDSLFRIQQLQEEASKKDEAFRIELDAANRLAELTKNLATTERERSKDLQEQMETLKEDASQQIGMLRAETDTEHRERETAEQRIVELEVQIERLEADVSTLSNQVSAQGASHHGVNGNAIGTPTRGGSTPTPYSPSSAYIKGGISLTQLYSDYSNMKRDLDAEKRRNEKLSTTIDEMINDLESRQPEIEELRMDHARLEADMAEMSSLVDSIGKERDQAVRNSRKKEGQLEAKIKEGEVLRQQLRDLSSQVKVLLMEAHLQAQGHDEASAERHHQLERLAYGPMDDESAEGLTDTDRLISENLVVFKSIAQLQEQNSNLLKLTRELGARMEREEATRETQTLADLQKKYEESKDEVGALVIQSKSLLRERDMFRRMLLNRGQLPVGSDNASMFGESITEETPATPTQRNNNGIEQTPNSRELSDYVKLVKDMQSHLDSYRQETSVDRSALKEQVESLSRSNGELRGEVARSNSQVTLSHERYEMLQANYAMLKTENEKLQERLQVFSANAVKQDLRTQQAVEDLIEARGLSDSLRNELAILKAEKEFWKSVEKRITEDNVSLSSERARLNTMNASLQSLLNEKEYSDAETRRKFLAQVETLEKDLQMIERKLSEEQEENRRAGLRLEFEQQENQKKIGDLMSSHGLLREELVAVKTTRDHLQTRVDEITVELRTAEERANLLQSSSGPRQDSTHPNEEDSDPSKEQELELEISELKRDLELSRKDLESAQIQVEQYKAISQSSEEQLQSINETNDLYRQEMDKVIEDKTAKVQEVQLRLDDLTSEHSSTVSELSELRVKDAESRQRLQEERSAFETQLAQLKDQDDRHAAAAQYHQEDLKAQAEIAQQAQQNYENELVKHAEAAKALQSVRSQFNELKIRIVELKTEAESARASLAQSEESWVESKDRYERELSEVRQGKENLVAQNNLLHKQLEDVSSQISNLRKRTTIGESESSINAEPAPGLENLHEVIKYLRREKEIVDVQLELSMQEVKRLKQQLDYTQSQLDDTRLKLNQQRRLEENNERTALNHQKLVDTINELNTFRESSVTLRNETRQAKASLAAKEKQVEDLMTQIEPLKAEVRELSNKKEMQEGQMKLLEENCERWQQRAQNILHKYDRIDPAELESLKEQVKSLEAERDDLRAAKQALQEEVEVMTAKILEAQNQGSEKVEELKKRLTEQFKARSKFLSGVIKEKETALQTASQEKSDLEQRFEKLYSEFKEAEVQRDQAVAKASAPQDSGTGSEDGQVDDRDFAELDSEIARLKEKLSAAEIRADEESSRVAGLQGEITICQSTIADLESQKTQMQQRLDKLQTEIDRFRPELQSDGVSDSNNVLEEQLAQLRQEVIQALQEADRLRAAASTNEVEDGGQSVAEQVNEKAESIRTEFESRHAEKVQQLEESFKKRSDQMKAQLTLKLTQGKEALAAEHQRALENLRSAHEGELESLRVRHQHEIDELHRDEASKFATFKEASIALNPASTVRDATAKSESEAIPTSFNHNDLTDGQIRELVKSNATVRNIMIGNINKQIKEGKDRIKEEHDKQLSEKLEETEKKAKSAMEHAVYMEQKRNALKLSMAENKFRALHPKMEVVRKAAQETPQKPVGEVWEIAKDAKPLASTGANSSGPSSGPSTVPSSLPSSLPSGIPSGLPSGLPSSLPSGLPPGPPSGIPSSLPSGIPSGITSGPNSGIPSSVPSSVPSGVPPSVPSSGSSFGPLADHPNTASNGPTTNPSKGVANTPASHRSNGPSTVGQTSGSLSGPPRGFPGGFPGGPSGGPSGGPPNQLLSGLLSGSVGGAMASSTRMPTAWSNNSRVPQRVPMGGLSGAARQFIPQANKRQREDGSQDGHMAGDERGDVGKRIRGGGGGS